MNDALENLAPGEGPVRKFLRLRAIAAGWRNWLEIEDRIFTAHNLRFYGFGVAILYTFFVSWLLFAVVFRPHGKGSIDFCWIWISGKFAVSSNPTLIYNRAAYTAAQDTFIGPGGCLFNGHYNFPPTFLFFTYLLGLMPYFIAFVVWVIITFVLYEAAIYTIIPRSAALIGAVAPIVVPVNALFGQNGYLTAGLIGLSLVFVERRPWLSGIFLGLLTYKPQFGILFPLVLVASRNWRALASATATSLIFGVAAAVAFGYQSWASFMHALLERNADLSPDAGFVIRLQSAYGLLRWAGASIWLSWAAHLIIAVIVAVSVYAVWAKPVPPSLKAAILCIGSVMVTPYVLSYDLCILSIAVAFLVSDGLSRGFLRGERTLILLCFAGLFVVVVPLSPIIFAVASLIVRRVLAWRRLDQATAPGGSLAAQQRRPRLPPEVTP